MTSTDTLQVGGSHYHNENGFPHWNLVILLGLDYLLGQATKYPVRWREKGGLLDLKKSLSYLNKRIEVGGGNESVPHHIGGGPLSLEDIGQTVTEFSTANGLTDLERAYILALCTWTEVQDLEAARELLFLLMDEAEALADAKPALLEDSNKHADRSLSEDVARGG